MAVNGRELNAAEVAYAAINHVEKVQFILHIKEIPTNEGRSEPRAAARSRAQLSVPHLSVVHDSRTRSPIRCGFWCLVLRFQTGL